jgi:hypothetical protein
VRVANPRDAQAPLDEYGDRRVEHGGLADPQIASKGNERLVGKNSTDKLGKRLALRPRHEELACTRQRGRYTIVIIHSSPPRLISTVLADWFYFVPSFA